MQMVERVPKRAGRLTIYDILCFLLLAVLCYFSFQQGDILHTAGSSFAYLNGHIIDFYDYNATYMGSNNYYPSTYILFAIWNLPIRLLGLVTEPTQNVSTGVIMWYKLLPTLFFLSSGMLIYHIGCAMGMENGKAKVSEYVFLTTLIVFEALFDFFFSAFSWTSKTFLTFLKNKPFYSIGWRFVEEERV